MLLEGILSHNVRGVKMYADNSIGKMLAVFVGIIIVGYSMIMSGKEVFILSPLLEAVFSGVNFVASFGK
jgi:hypothetical protein